MNSRETDEFILITKINHSINKIFVFTSSSTPNFHFKFTLWTNKCMIYSNWNLKYSNRIYREDYEFILNSLIKWTNYTKFKELNNISYRELNCLLNDSKNWIINVNFTTASPPILKLDKINFIISKCSYITMFCMYIQLFFIN